MNILRSIIFNIFFFTGSLFWSLALLWVLVLPNKTALSIVGNTYVRYINLIEKYIMGITLKIEGLENIPSDGKFIIAAKHQSAFETLNIPYMSELHYPAIVLKESLKYIPIWGLYTVGLGHIAINRGSATVAMRSIIRGAKKSLKNDRPFIIFPEGTRKEVGAKPDYKSGIAKIYKETNVPVIPLALNTGQVWGRNSFIKHPGVVTYKFMPAIEPGIKTSEFMKQLEETIETETNKLVEAENKRKGLN